MPMFDFICEICEVERREWRREKSPRFCNRICANKARSRGLVRAKKNKWPVTPEMHEEIKRLYQTQADMTNGHPIRAYAESIGYPRWKITRYAMSQGWATRQKKEPDWSAKELEILGRSAHRHPEVIARHLKKAGFSRSVTGIVLKRKRTRFLQNKGGYSARQVARGFGIDEHCVTRWIRLGRLKAKKRGTKRTARQGGDIYYIKDKWIRDFILKYLPEVDLRKVDKYWFVDLLAGRQGGCGPLSIVKLTEIEDEEYGIEESGVSPRIAQAMGKF